MYNSYSYTNAPEISSVAENALNIFCHDESVPVRLLNLKGIRIRFYINKSDKNVHINTSSNLSIDLLKAYKELFSQLTERFFADDAYIYGVLNEEKLYIYDIYTNENWLSERDMEKIKNEYGYGELGFTTLTPLIEGILKTREIIEAVSAVDDVRFIKLFPCVYVKFDTDSIEQVKTLKDTLYVGEEKKYNYYNGYNSFNDYDNYYNKKDDDDDYYNTHVWSPSEHAYVLKKNCVKSDKEVKVVPKEFTLLNKKERTESYYTVKKNVEDYISKNGLSESLKEGEKKLLRIVCYLYSLNCLPKTRQLIYNYYETDYFKETNYAALSSEDDIYVWSDVFVKYWKNNFKDELKRIKNLDDLSTTLVYIILYEELSCFSNFYEKEMFPGK
jgi:hypothetical protein